MQVRIIILRMEIEGGSQQDLAHDGRVGDGMLANLYLYQMLGMDEGGKYICTV